MKKIMFNDKFGLTDAVLEGRKTMTRRIVPQSVVDNYMYDTDPKITDAARFKIGDVVAIAQSYNDVNSGGYPVDSRYDPFRTAYYSVGSVKESDKGWNNKMFVRADLMPHHIKITNVRVERLQDCSDDDILKEGVSQISAPINGIGYTFKGWTERGVECSSDTPLGAFKALIDKTCGKGTWEKNPLVFVYEFDLFD